MVLMAEGIKYEGVGIRRLQGVAAVGGIIEL